MTKLLKQPPLGPGHLFLSPVPSPQVGCWPDATRAPRWPPLRVSAQRETPQGARKQLSCPAELTLCSQWGRARSSVSGGPGGGPGYGRAGGTAGGGKGGKLAVPPRGGLLAPPESRKRLFSHRTKLLLLSLGRRQGSGRGEPTGLNTAAGGFIPWLGRRRGSKREGKPEVSASLPSPTCPSRALSPSQARAPASGDSRPGSEWVLRKCWRTKEGSLSSGRGAGCGGDRGRIPELRPRGGTRWGRRAGP